MMTRKLATMPFTMRTPERGKDEAWGKMLKKTTRE
jgi:hypothetical protein